MIPTNFTYSRAQSIDEAIEALDGDAKLLAGGHSLLPALKLRLNEAGKLIDISRLEGLQKLEMDGENLLIGAGVTHGTIASSDLVKSQVPLFAEVAASIGDIQIRNAGTIGGSLAHADPAADWPAALLACDAKVVVKGKSGERSIAAGDFFEGLFTTALADDELILHVSVPSKKGYRCGYAKFSQPASRFAIVGCAVCFSSENGHMQDVRVAYTGASDMPYRDAKAAAALEGKSLSDSTIKAAVEERDESPFMMSDHFASEEYRRHLTGVMLARALSSAS